MTYRSASIPRDWHSIVHNNPARSYKVNDFCVIWKSLCDFLLVINNDRGSISRHFWDTATYWKTHVFFYSTLIQPQILKCSPWLNRWIFAYAEPSTSSSSSTLVDSCNPLRRLPHDVHVPLHSATSVPICCIQVFRRHPKGLRQLGLCPDSWQPFVAMTWFNAWCAGVVAFREPSHLAI